jgi:hypothetical protein
LSRRDPFSPVDGFTVGGHPIEDVSDDLDVCSTATGPAEFPQLAGRPVIVVDRCAITAEQGFFENIWSFINADDQIGTLFTRQA